MFSKTFNSLETSANLEETIIRAPEDGLITDVPFAEGETVTTAEDIITLKTDGAPSSRQCSRNRYSPRQCGRPRHN